MIKSNPTIALFGGSFDPPHKGHQAIVEKLSKMNTVDKIIVMPNYQNPFKDATLASAQQRVQWCSDLFCDNPSVIVSDYEASGNKAAFTIDTIKELNQKYTVKYLAIGSDNLDKIQEWKDFDQINNLVEWIVITRGKISKEQTDPLRKFQIMQLDYPVSSTQIRQGRQIESIDNKIAKQVNRLINNKGQK